MLNILWLVVAVEVGRRPIHQVVVEVVQVDSELPPDLPLPLKDTLSPLAVVGQEQQRTRVLALQAVTLYSLALLQQAVGVAVQLVFHKVLLVVLAEEILTITRVLVLLRHLLVREMLEVAVLEIYLTPVAVVVVERVQQALVALAATVALAAQAVLELQAQSVVHLSPTLAVEALVVALEVLEPVVQVEAAQEAFPQTGPALMGQLIGVVVEVVELELEMAALVALASSLFVIPRTARCILAPPTPPRLTWRSIM